MADYPPEELPAHGQLADEFDALDWRVERDGRMRDFATDDEPITVPWEG